MGVLWAGFKLAMRLSDSRPRKKVPRHQRQSRIVSKRIGINLMLQDKPKRKRSNRLKQRSPQRAALMVLLAVIISVPTTLIWTGRQGDQLADMVAMGIILCCLIVIVHQAVLTLLQVLLGTDESSYPAGVALDALDDLDDL